MVSTATTCQVRDINSKSRRNVLADNRHNTWTCIVTTLETKVVQSKGASLFLLVVRIRSFNIQAVIQFIETKWKSAAKENNAS